MWVNSENIILAIFIMSRVFSAVIFYNYQHILHNLHTFHLVARNIHYSQVHLRFTILNVVHLAWKLQEMNFHHFVHNLQPEDMEEHVQTLEARKKKFETGIPKNINENLPLEIKSYLRRILQCCILNIYHELLNQLWIRN